MQEYIVFSNSYPHNVIMYLVSPHFNFLPHKKNTKTPKLNIAIILFTWLKGRHKHEGKKERKKPNSWINWIIKFCSSLSSPIQHIIDSLTCNKPCFLSTTHLFKDIHFFSSLFTQYISSIVPIFWCLYGREFTLMKSLRNLPVYIIYIWREEQ